MFVVRELLQRRGAAVVKQCPSKVKISERNFREPDVCVLLDSNSPHPGLKFWSSADVVFEVVSPSNPDRDYNKRRLDYATAGIAEYWIVDPLARRITMLRFAAGANEEVGVFVEGQTAASGVLEGLQIDVAACLAAGNDAAKNEEPTA